MTKKSVALYLFIIGLLLLGAIGWYVYSYLSQPEPDDAPTVPAPRPGNPAGATISRSTETPEVTQPEPEDTPLAPPPRPGNSAVATVSQAAATAPAALTPTPVLMPFDGQRAYEDVQTQVSFGPRVPGSEGHARIQEWMQEELKSAGWTMEIQASETLGHPIENLVARRGAGPPEILLGAHYDTRLFADSDPDPARHNNPVPGANDGASGVALLLELARVLPADSVPVWLVFFDAEDNGRIEGWDWILGSREFVQKNPVRPQAVVIVDMIGDADLQIYREYNSDPRLMDEIWTIAAQLGYGDRFIPEYRHTMTDDHTPFVEVGIPAVDIIDFDYPYWHTVQDTPDKVSAESLQAVGDTLYTWILQQEGSQP